MDPIVLITLVVQAISSLAVAATILFIKLLWSQIEDIKAETKHNRDRQLATSQLFQDFQVSIPREYLRRDELSAMEKRIESRIDKLDENLTGNFSRIYDKIESKVDK